MVQRERQARFVYRDSVWRGCDLIGAGVASFSHVGDVHFQNESDWEPYLTRIEAGELPLARAMATSATERLTRELILQLKLGKIEVAYFRDKFAVDILSEFREPLERLSRQDMLTISDGSVTLTRQGLLRVDTLLHEFYETRYRGARYT
jgi:oxygen-independent coproporphyrinogen-3 oxidase